jgi:hypothetical protein
MSGRLRSRVINRAFEPGLYGDPPARCIQNLMALCAQSDTQQSADWRFVVNYQNLERSSPHPMTPAVSVPLRSAYDGKPSMPCYSHSRAKSH